MASISQRREYDMKSIKKAPAYEQARNALDSNFAKTGEILTIRDLKAACGGIGSLETYKQYRDQWRAERVQAMGLDATLLAMINQVSAHAAIMKSLADQALLQSAMTGLNSAEADLGDETDADDQRDDGAGEDGNVIPDAAEEVVASPEQPKVKAAAGNIDVDFGELAPLFAQIERLSDVPIYPAGIRTRSPDDVDKFAEDFAEQAEARFLAEDAASRADDSSSGQGENSATSSASMPTAQDATSPSLTSLSRHDGGGPQTAHPRGPNQPSQGESEKFHGESPSSRSAPVPTVQGPAPQTATSLSRSNGGAQQGALPLEPKKPAQGESDTTGGSPNGTA